jgi:hypothetical protein
MNFDKQNPYGWATYRVGAGVVWSRVGTLASPFSPCKIASPNSPYKHGRQNTTLPRAALAPPPPIIHHSRPYAIKKKGVFFIIES